MLVVNLQVSPSYIARQRSNQRLPVTVNIVDDLGQQISGGRSQQRYPDAHAVVPMLSGI